MTINDQSFILSAADLYAHQTQADLVVLSACHSASGKIYQGEGVQGMSKAFMVAGARNILSSLWSASELSSMHLITSFLEQVSEGLSYDQALHQAKLAYLANSRPSQQHPFYWSNFVLIGTQETRTTTFPYWLNYVLGAVLVVILGIGLYFYQSRMA